MIFYYTTLTAQVRLSPDRSCPECDRILRATTTIQNERILEWDLVITAGLVTAMRKSELLNLTWADIDFERQIVEVNPKRNTTETWEWKIKDTDCRVLPLKEDVIQLLVNLQNQRPDGYPYVFVPRGRYDHIQQKLCEKGRSTYHHARTSVINNFKRMFDKMLAHARVDEGTFHDIRRTAITNWLYEDLNIYDVMRLAGHSKYETTYRYYLQVKDGLLDRARGATKYTVSRDLLQKCCNDNHGRVKEKGPKA